MVSNTAIITSSGRAYYKLSTELKKRKIEFLSLTPDEAIPMSVRVIVTTDPDKNKIDHPRVFVYDANEDAAPVIERVIQAIRGKDRYEKLVLGVDPGKRFGLAIMGDCSVVRTTLLSSTEEAAKAIVEAVNRIDAVEKIVKIGNGAPASQSRLIELLDGDLPLNVVIESVEERGTTRHATNLPFEKKRVRDVNSAIQISLREGHRLNRRRKNA